MVCPDIGNRLTAYSTYGKYASRASGRRVVPSSGSIVPALELSTPASAGVSHGSTVPGTGQSSPSLPQQEDLEDPWEHQNSPPLVIPAQYKNGLRLPDVSICTTTN